MESPEPKPAAEARQHAAFFRQSGWLMVANIAAGMMMWAVHFLARSTGPKEYGIFGAFLAVAMCIPTLPLQMVLAHQTAQALATGRERQLAGMFRLIWLVTTALWLIGMVFVVALHHQILARWQITNPAVLWITVPIVLLAMWQPLFSGVLQGQQNFFWLGWSMLANGIGRLVIASVAVLIFSGLAAGMMTGVLTGMGLAVLIAVWYSRNIWTAPSAPFDWRSFLGQVLPLMIGFGAFQVLFTADTMFAKAYFDSATVGFYVSAGTMSRALMWLVGPLATVMFPRLVHSAAKGEKTNLMTLVFLGTAVLAVSGAVGLTIVGPLVVRIVYGPAFVAVASSMLPWYAAAMVPLALANVLLNHLLAHSHFKVVPGLCVLAVAYVFALTRFHATPITILQTLGVFNLLLLLLCAAFTWLHKGSAEPEPTA